MVSSTSMADLSAYAVPQGEDALMFFTPLQAVDHFFEHRETLHCSGLRNTGNGITGAVLHLCLNRVAEADPLPILCATCLTSVPASISGCNAEGNLSDVYSYRLAKPRVQLAPSGMLQYDTRNSASISNSHFIRHDPSKPSPVQHR
jgi:hypothetical protein